MTPFKTIRLAYPLVTASGVLTEVTIRRARAQDAVTFARIDATKPDPIAKMSALIAALSGMPEDAVEDLDFEDFARIAETVSAAVSAMGAAVRQGRPHTTRKR